MNGRSFLRKLKTASIGAAMADMALLLLVFFMATTTTEPPKGVEVALPEAETQGAEQDSIYITISADGGLYYDSKPIALEQLADRLGMRRGEKDNVVAVTADKGLPYREVRRVLDMLREQDFLNVVFMAEPKEGR